MSDDDGVQQAAREYVEMHGASAVRWLIEQAERAEGIGDIEAGGVWREIAAAANALLGLGSEAYSPRADEPSTRHRNRRP